MFWSLLLGASCLLCVLYVASPRKGDLNLHLAKALIQFLVILFFGALVADSFKRAERQKTEEEHLARFRDDIRIRLGDCYRGAMRARSRLRAAGITTHHCDSNAPMGEHELEAYRMQCEALNEAQLGLEKVWHEVDCFRCAFTHADDIIRRIQIMSGFLRKVIDEYEAQWCVLATLAESGTPPELPKLGHVVGPSTTGWFREKYCDRYSEAVDFIRRDELRAKL